MKKLQDICNISIFFLCDSVSDFTQHYMENSQEVFNVFLLFATPLCRESSTNIKLYNHNSVINHTILKDSSEEGTNKGTEYQTHLSPISQIETTLVQEGCD